jgi:hypothetical protein
MPGKYKIYELVITVSNKVWRIRPAVPGCPAALPGKELAWDIHKPGTKLRQDDGPVWALTLA